MKTRVQVKGIGSSLVGIKVPDTALFTGEPFYILLTVCAVEKGWRYALIDAMTYYSTLKRALMAQESDYDKVLAQAIVYLESLILMTEGERNANT